MRSTQEQIIQHLTEAIALMEQMPDFLKSAPIYRQLNETRYWFSEKHGIEEVLYLDEAKNQPQFKNGDGVISLKDIQRSNIGMPWSREHNFTYAEKGAVGTVIGMNEDLVDVRFGNHHVYGIPANLLDLYTEGE